MADLKIDFSNCEVSIEKMFDIHDNEAVYVSVDNKGRMPMGNKLNDSPLPDSKEDIDLRGAKEKEEVERQLRRLLRGEWFAQVRAQERYDAEWTDAFVGALMASEHGTWLAEKWNSTGGGKANHPAQVQAYVVGLLRKAGVIKESESLSAIAKQIVKEHDPATHIHLVDTKGLKAPAETFARNMGESRLRDVPFADWVRGRVVGER